MKNSVQLLRFKGKIKDVQNIYDWLASDIFPRIIANYEAFCPENTSEMILYVLCQLTIV